MIDAEFSYEESAGRVMYDPEETDPAEFIEELAAKTGFLAMVVEAAPNLEEEPNDTRR